jgi:hypothetical protein
MVMAVTTEQMMLLHRLVEQERTQLVKDKLYKENSDGVTQFAMGDDSAVKLLIQLDHLSDMMKLELGEDQHGVDVSQYWKEGVLQRVCDYLYDGNCTSDLINMLVERMSVAEVTSIIQEMNEQDELLRAQEDSGS